MAKGSNNIVNVWLGPGVFSWGTIKTHFFLMKWLTSTHLLCSIIVNSKQQTNDVREIACEAVQKTRVAESGVASMLENGSRIGAPKGDLRLQWVATIISHARCLTR